MSRNRSLVALGLAVVGARAAELYLGTAGVGRITIVDHDAVDLTNLQRQIAHNLARVGHPKAESARDAINNYRKANGLKPLKLDAELATLRESLTQDELKLQQLLADQRAAEAQIETCRVQQSEASERLGAVQAEGYRVSGELARIEQLNGRPFKLWGFGWERPLLGVLGAGTMGAGIAQLGCAASQCHPHACRPLRAGELHPAFRQDRTLVGTALALCRDRQAAGAGAPEAGARARRRAHQQVQGLAIGVQEPPRRTEHVVAGEDRSDLLIFDYLVQNVDRWGGDFTNVRSRANDGPLVFLDSAEQYTLPVGVAMFQSSYATDYGLTFAACVATKLGTLT